MPKTIIIEVPQDFSGKTVDAVLVSSGGFVAKGTPLLTFSDGGQFVSQDGGMVNKVMVSSGDVLTKGKPIIEMDIDENVSNVELNGRTRMLSKLLTDSIASMSIQVQENGRMERKPLSFSIQGERLNTGEVCSPGGLMSLFVLSASDMFNDAFRRQEGSFPVVYYYDQNALMEVVPYFPSNEEMKSQGFDPDMPDLAFANIVHFMHFAIEDYVEKNSAPEMLVDNEVVPLDPLFQKWYEARQSYKVTVYHPPRPEVAPSHSSGPMSV